MEEQKPRNPRPESDEIDVSQVFRLIGNALNSVFRAFLRVFLYLKRRAILLTGLLILGLAIGYGLSKVVTKKQEIEVIVKPNLESKNYLYDVVGEIQANIEAEDLAFFKKLGIETEKLRTYMVDVAPVKQEAEDQEEDIAYLELLQKFENTGIITDVLRAEILNRSSLNHRITFTYKDKEYGEEFARKAMEYINGNKYFQELVATSQENSRIRIEENKLLIDQIDLIITNYSKKMGSESPGIAGDGRIVLESEEAVDLTGLLELKNALIRDIEGRKLSLLEQKDPVSIINFGNPHQVQKALFAKKVILIPTIFICLFLLFDFVRYLNRRAMSL